MSDKKTSLLPRLDDPVGTVCREQNLPEGVMHLMKLFLHFQSANQRDGPAAPQELIEEMEWLESALNKILDNSDPPMKALKLQVGRGRKKLASEQVKEGWRLVERVERLRRDKNVTQSEAIYIAAGGEEYAEALRGKYQRALPGYKEDQERKVRLGNILAMMRDPIKE